MSCGSCAARIERRLNRLDGVVATVNFATERAYIASTGGREPDELISVIESVGYRAARPAPPRRRHPYDDAARLLRWRLVVCVPLAPPVIVMSMVPAAQFPGWQWLCLVLAGIVALWGAGRCTGPPGWGWAMARHHGHAGQRGHHGLVRLVAVRAVFRWCRHARHADVLRRYLRTGQRAHPVPGRAAGVTVAVLAGRYLEARAKRESGSALTTLAGLAAKTVAVLRDGGEQRVPSPLSPPGDRFVVRPGEKIATDGVVVAGRSAVDASLVTGESMPPRSGRATR